MENINWNDWFYYDETSPSYLRWRVDVFCGKNYNVPITSKGAIAGSLHKFGGYRVHLNKKGYEVHRVIYVLLTGNKLSNHLVVDHIDGDASNNNIYNLRLTTQKINTRNRVISSNNTSGVNGVGIQQNINSTYVMAYWYNEDGSRNCKAFNVNKLGIMVAFRNAVQHREQMIKELNVLGAGYTERHGK
jgi:hypothetical protein